MCGRRALAEPRLPSPLVLQLFDQQVPAAAAQAMPLLAFHHLLQAGCGAQQGGPARRHRAALRRSRIL